MARLFDNSVSNYLVLAESVLAVWPGTLSIWARPTSAIGSAEHTLLSMSDTTDNDPLFRTMVSATAKAQFQVRQRSGANTNNVIGTTTLSADTWYNVIGTANSDGHGEVFLNGTSEASSATTLGSVTFNRTSIGALVRGSVAQPFPGRLAEAGIWSVVLTQGEINMLAAGVSPLLVRRAALVGHWPIIGSSPEVDWSGNGKNMSVTDTLAIADHAPVRSFFNRPVGWRGEPAAAAGGALEGTSDLSFTPSAVLTGTGALNGTAALAFSNTGTLSGAGALSGTSAVAFAASNVLTAKGSLSATASVQFANTGVLTATGALNGTSTPTFAGAAVLKGTGALAGTASIEFAGSATPALDGALLGTADLVFAGTAELKATGALIGTAAVAFTGTAQPAVDGALNGTAALTFAGQAEARAVGALNGVAAVAFDTAALLVGTAGLIGTSTIAFTATDILTAVGSLIGSSDLVFSGTASPEEPVPPPDQRIVNVGARTSTIAVAGRAGIVVPARSTPIVKQ